MAGVSRLQYSSEIRLVRVMCSGRVDLRFVLRAFANGHDGVFIGGCRLNECNYVTHGNYDALAMVHVARFLLAHMGLYPERLNITFMSGGDGNILAEAIDGFTKKIKGLGPLGTAEGMEPGALKLKLEAAERIVPYLRLVERERLRAPSKTKEEYERFFESGEVVRLFREIIAEKWELSRIMLLLGEGPLPTGEISRRLSLSPSDVSKHMNASSRHGLVKYDVERKRYSLA
jgi:coenzyme F420-reducing hydrogenase delta subunit